MASPRERFLLGTRGDDAASLQTNAPVAATQSPRDRFLGSEPTTASVLPTSEKLIQSMQAQNSMGIPMDSDPSAAITAFSERQLAEEQQYLQENVVDNVPLDVRSGADVMTRLRLGLQRNKLGQLEVLRKMYGDKIRLDTKGNFIVRTTEGGQPRDILVDEPNLSLKDFLDLSSEVPAFALSIATTKGVPVKEIFKSAFRGALGYAAGGTATDAATRIAESQPLDWDILSERGTGAVTDTLVGYGLGKGISAIGILPKLARLASSSASETTKEAAMREVEAGRQAMTQRFRIEMEPTVAELTGNPMALRLETFLSNIPIARKWILSKWQKQIDNEKAIQSAFFGGQTPDPERTGRELIDLLGGEIERTEEIAGKAASIVRRQGEEAITDPLAAIGGRELTPFQFGSRMTRRGEAQLQNFKTKAAELYDNIKAVPESTAPLFGVGPIMRKAQALKNELIKTASGDTATSLAPAGVETLLDQVTNLKPQQSYFDLVKLRDAIYDRIDSPEPISSRGSRMLKDLGASITREMYDQGPTVFGPRKWPLVEEATTFYRENVESFYQKGIVDMLKPRTEMGKVAPPETIAAQLLKGGKGSVTTYNTFKEFFEKGGAVKDMNRLLRDKILEGGTDTATGLIKVEDLANSINKLEPEIAKELFGKSKDEMLKAFRQGMIATEGLKVRVPGEFSGVVSDELKRLIDAGQLDGRAVHTLVQKTLEMRKQYSNSIRRAVKTNDLGVIEASPETFVKEYLFNSKTPISELRDVMQSVYRTGNAELIEDVRRSFVSEVFKASAKDTKGDVAQVVARIQGSPLRDIDPQKFAIVLEDPNIRRRAEEILGPDGFGDLKNFALSIGGRAMRDAAGSLTGAFTGGSLFEKMLSGLSGLTEVPKYIALSWLTTSPRTISLLRSAEKLSPVDTAKAVKAAVLTPEFMRVLASDAPNSEEANLAAQEIKRWAEGGEPNAPPSR